MKDHRFRGALDDRILLLLGATHGKISMGHGDDLLPTTMSKKKVGPYGSLLNGKCWLKRAT